MILFSLACYGSITLWFLIWTLSIAWCFFKFRLDLQGRVTGSLFPEICVPFCGLCLCLGLLPLAKLAMGW